MLTTLLFFLALIFSVSITAYVTYRLTTRRYERAIDTLLEEFQYDE